MVQSSHLGGSPAKQPSRHGRVEIQRGAPPPRPSQRANRFFIATNSCRLFLYRHSFSLFSRNWVLDTTDAIGPFTLVSAGAKGGDKEENLAILLAGKTLQM